METPKDYTPSPSRLPKLKFNKKVQVVLICLFVSIVFWLLIAMSKQYVDKFTFPVQYINFPSYRVVVNDLPQTINVAVQTSGFKILSHHFTKVQEPVVFDVTENLKNALDPAKESVTFASSSLRDVFSAQLGNEYTVMAITPDSILFSFSNKMNKKVPVKLNYSLRLEKQFDTTGANLLQPDSVIISGPASLVSGVNLVNTVRLKLDNVRSTVKTRLAFIPLEQVTTDVDCVSVVIPVEKVTEGVVEVPVHAINISPGYTLKTFPDKVNIRYMVALSRYNDVNPELFSVTADAANLPDSKVTQLKLRLQTAPSFLRAAVMEPEKVDYIIRK